MGRRKIRRLPLSRLEPGASIMIIGQRHTGKSVLQWDLLSHMQDWFSFGLALTPTESSRERLVQCLPVGLVQRQSPEKIENMMSMMDKINRKRARKGQVPKNACLICDDTAFDEAFMRSKAMVEMAMNGRHKKLTYIATLQYIKSVKPAARNNMDFVFIRYEGDLKIRKEIRESWFGALSKKDFDEIFDKATENYGCLVLDSRARANSRDWRDYIFWYRARVPEDIPAFRLCKVQMDMIDKSCVREDGDDTMHDVKLLGAGKNRRRARAA